MSIKADYLQGKLAQLCGPNGRLTPPRNLGERAQVDELAALSRALDRLAPQHGYEDWWPKFEDVLLASIRTRAWPTINELTNAAAKVPRARPVAVAGEDALDWREEAKRSQLRAWAHGQGPIAPHLVTIGRCLAIGLTHQQAQQAIAFVPDPYNHGIDPDLTAEQRVANRARRAA